MYTRGSPLQAVHNGTWQVANTGKHHLGYSNETDKEYIFVTCGVIIYRGTLNAVDH